MFLLIIKKKQQWGFAWEMVWIHRPKASVTFAVLTASLVLFISEYSI